MSLYSIGIPTGCFTMTHDVSVQMSLPLKNGVEET